MRNGFDIPKSLTNKLQSYFCNDMKSFRITNSVVEWNYIIMWGRLNIVTATVAIFLLFSYSDGYVYV